MIVTGVLMEVERNYKLIQNQTADKHAQAEHCVLENQLDD